MPLKILLKKWGIKIKRKSVILLVDDNPENLKLLATLIEGDNYEAVLALSAFQALEFLYENKVDLILLDIMMPGMNGIELCKLLKKDEMQKDVPVIFLTAKTKGRDLIEGFNAGAVDYISKPFEPKELLMRIKTHLQLKQTQKELKDSLNKISEQNAELEQLDQLKDRFVRMASHDLMNPISSINATAQLLINPDIENTQEDSYRFLKNIKRESDFCITLLKELLDLNNIKSGKLPLRKTKSDYIEFIESVIDANKLLALNKNIKLSFSTELNSLILNFDQLLMRQMLNNLLSNAFKYSDSNTSVIVEIKKNEKELVTSIIDEGQGIEESEIDLLFDEFYKSDHNKSTAGEKSSGLGLFICKTIVQKHGGYIAAKNNAVKGSNFYFSLPLNIVK